jgi:hypothetical protein
MTRLNADRGWKVHQSLFIVSIVLDGSHDVSRDSGHLILIQCESKSLAKSGAALWQSLTQKFQNVFQTLFFECRRSYICVTFSTVAVCPLP